MLQSQAILCQLVPKEFAHVVGEPLIEHFSGGCVVNEGADAFMGNEMEDNVEDGSPGEFLWTIVELAANFE